MLLAFRSKNNYNFQPINCASVRVILNREGRPSGDAIAEFETDDDVEEAMKKNREHLGSRFVVLTREKDHQTKYAYRYLIT